MATAPPVAPAPVDPAALVPLLDAPIVVADAGCRWGAASDWRALDPAVRVLAFDADADECARLAALQQPGDPVRYVPVALADRTGTATLHVAREPACSSLFPPDPVSLRERPELAIVETVRTEEIRVERLDDWLAGGGEGPLDALKLDVQGAEAAVIEGAGAALADARLVETEVTFTPMYAGQALFGDVDAALRARGFALWRLGHLVHYGGVESALTPGPALHSFYDGRHEGAADWGGQLYWGHAHYVAAGIAFREPGPWSGKVRDAAVCACAGFHDLARWALQDALAAGPPPDARAVIAGALGVAA